MMKSPCILAILDGWGHGPASPTNAIDQANTPYYDQIIKQQPMSLLSASGEDVGLPKGQMGNSEVGHLHIGAGRLVRQSLSTIDHAITQNTLNDHKLLTELDTKTPTHLLGLVSPGGVHSHENHLLALIDLLADRGHTTLVVHAILDGRDTAPKAALASIQRIESRLNHHQCGHIASLCGRFYAMDRDQRWDRTEAAFNLYTQSNAITTAESAQAAIQSAYNQNQLDEFILPVSIQHGRSHNVIEADHQLLLFNFRADRMRQMTAALTQEDFTGFDRGTFTHIKKTVCMTEYQSSFQLPVLFPKPMIPDTLGETLSAHQLRQHRIAETEKFAHVTYFLNGGREEAFDQEERLLIPSDKVATYDLKPQMQAEAITDAIIDLIKEQQSDVIIANFANPDMVGHTGNFEATVAAIECIDKCLERLGRLCYTHQATLFITADHGNAETMFDAKQQQQHTAHTCNRVPFIAIGATAHLHEKGTLADIAPTILTYLGITPPHDMTGRSLLT